MEKKSFTLIELLIVIAIIAILAAMLLPALNHARSTAKQANCISNQKQVMMAQIQYATDYNDQMVVCAKYGGSNTPETFVTILTRKQSNTNAMPTLAAGASAYLRFDVLSCPAHPDHKNFDVWNGTYGMWKQAGIVARCKNTGPIFKENKDKPSDWCNVTILPNRSKAPSKTFILADTLRSIDAGSEQGKQFYYFFPGELRESSGVGLVHKNQANCSFIDGHVESLNKEEMNKSATELKFYVDNDLVGKSL